MTDPRIADSTTGHKTTGRGAARVFDIMVRFIFWITVFVLSFDRCVRIYQLIEPGSSAATLDMDFVILWAAGKLAFAGHPLMVHVEI
jgi:hypothetical protein